MQGVIDYKAMYQEVYEYHKKYIVIQNTEDYWDQMTKESCEIAFRYNNHPFIVALLVAVVEDITRRYQAIEHIAA